MVSSLMMPPRAHGAKMSAVASKIASGATAVAPNASTPPSLMFQFALDPRFDLSVNNAPAAQVFLSIVSGTRYSMLVHPQVAGTISLNLNNVTDVEYLDFQYLWAEPMTWRLTTALRF